MFWWFTVYPAFAIADYTTNPSSVKTKASAVNGGLDSLRVCDVGQLRKRQLIPTTKKAIYHFMRCGCFIVQTSRNRSRSSACGGNPCRRG